ncbi:MAG: hypothetical protein L6Q83_07175 [Gammaproteobacteria bacterium]|nr:hypothetical protein [Gammaproteobacteria bacterium]
MKLMRLPTLLGLLGLVLLSPAAMAAYVDKDPSSDCSVRVHYPASIPSAAETFVVAVGTAMSRSDYDFLAAQLNGKGYVVVAMDHARGNMVKTDAGKFQACANLVKANIAGWLAPHGFSTVAHWIMGGHSAGGQAAQNAISANPALTDAIFSIDPYNLSGAGTVTGPALYWGFTTTTCFVDVDDAAKAGYYGTGGQRVLVRVKKKYSFGPCGYSPKYFHCSFCDGHCPGCTNCMTTPNHFFVDVGNTVQKFINAAFYGTWSKANLTVATTTPVDFFVDSDAP